MPTSEPIEKPSRRRRSDSVVVNITFDREALTILKQHCPPGRKGTGRLLGVHTTFLQKLSLTYYTHNLWQRPCAIALH